MHSLYSPLAFALLLGLPILQDAAHEPSAEATSAEASVAATEAAVTDETDSAILGEPLIVNGVRIPDVAIKRTLTYDVGRLLYRTVRLQALIDAELELMAEAGVDISQFDVKQEEIDKWLNWQRGKFDKSYPHLDWDTEMRRAYGSLEWHEKQLRQTVYFDKIFLPKDPADWPDLTKEAIRAGAGEFWIEDAVRSYESRKKYAETTGGELPNEEVMWQGLTRDIVVQALEKYTDIEHAAHGISPEIAVVVGGKAITTEELWEEVADFIDPYDVMVAKRWLAMIEAARQRLAKETVLDAEGNEISVLYSAEEFAQYWHEIYDSKKDQGGGGMTLESAVQVGQGFPSVESYSEYVVIKQSIARLLGAALEKDENGNLSKKLEAQLPRSNRNLGVGKVDAQVILISAFDFPNYRWKENGWEWAKTHAEKIKVQLDENKAAHGEHRRLTLRSQARGEEPPTSEVIDPEVFWVNMLEDHCEFWDPPPPLATERKPSTSGYKMKGRWGEKTRADLARYMGEFTYNEALWHDTVSNYVFFEQLPNTISQPMKGPYGYYIVKLLKRTKPSRLPDYLGIEKHFEFLVNDYLREVVAAYFKQALEEADIQGVKI